MSPKELLYIIKAKHVGCRRDGRALSRLTERSEARKSKELKTNQYEWITMQEERRYITTFS